MQTFNYKDTVKHITNGVGIVRNVCEISKAITTITVYYNNMNKDVLHILPRDKFDIEVINRPEPLNNKF